MENTIMFSDDISVENNTSIPYWNTTKVFLMSKKYYSIFLARLK